MLCTVWFNSESQRYAYCIIRSMFPVVGSGAQGGNSAMSLLGSLGSGRFEIRYHPRPPPLKALSKERKEVASRISLCHVSVFWWLPNCEAVCETLRSGSLHLD